VRISWLRDSGQALNKEYRKTSYSLLYKEVKEKLFWRLEEHPRHAQGRLENPGRRMRLFPRLFSKTPCGCPIIGHRDAVRIVVGVDVSR
jgi:hypothetical protein